MDLPTDLRAALTAELDDIPIKDVVRAGSELSTRYRASYGGTTDTLASSGVPSVRSSLDAIAYAAYRLPATYAAIRAVFREVRERRSDFHPATLLDVGGGPGTVAWAATDTWSEIEHVTILERDPRMIQIGQALATHATSSVIRRAVWQAADITGPGDASAAGITVAAYVIGEIREVARAEVVRRLWERTVDTCIIIEPGTPRGSALTRQAGEQLTQAGARHLAPFPAHWRCVESADDWCHFSERVPRTRMLRSVKGGTLSYEDEKYSYVAVSRVEGLPIAARVIRHPQVRSGHIRLVLCTPNGVKHIVVARSNREAYRRARELRWGAAIPIEDGELYGLQ